MLLGSDDIGGELAEAYGYVNRSLPDAELDGFVEALATRIASFDKWAIANTKRLVNAASLPPDVEMAAGWDACMASIARPVTQDPDQGLFEQGFHKPGDVEDRLGSYLGASAPESTRGAATPGASASAFCSFGKDTIMDLLAFAKGVADRVEAEASRAKVPVAVCVIDIHGNVVLHHRMSGAPAFSIELSERKAYTSALVGMRTADLLPLVQPGQPLFPLMTVSEAGTARWAAGRRSPRRSGDCRRWRKRRQPSSRMSPSSRRGSGKPSSRQRLCRDGYTSDRRYFAPLSLSGFD